MINKFEDLIAWQTARRLMILVNKLTHNDMFKKDYSLVDQIIRSVRSIMSNIAEGFGRYKFNDYKHFLTMARGSLTETQNHLYIALDLQYINQEEFDNAYHLTEEVYKLLNGIIAHLKNTIKTTRNN
jgi:four helix bundle protein